MTREEKTAEIAELKEKFSNAKNFYITDTSDLNVETVGNLRRICFDKGIELRVAKNTLIKKALDELDGDYENVYDSLKGPSALMFSEIANAPAKIIEEFRKTNEKPVLKVAYIDKEVFVGDDQVATLSSLKSKEELVGEIIGLLQSPAKNVISALQSSGNKLAGILKTLADR